MDHSASGRLIFSSAVSQKADATEAAQEAVESIAKALGNASVDLAFLFISPHYRDQAEIIHNLILKEAKPGVLLGCSACGVIGSSHELENVKAVSLFAAHLPGANLKAFQINQSELEGYVETGSIGGHFDVSREDHPTFFLIPDPFTFDAAEFLRLVDQSFPHSPVMGGMASAASAPGGNILFMNEQRFTEGAIGVTLTGDVEVATLVSQGCRPFGEPLIVTGAEENVIQELAGKPPVEVLRDAFMNASKQDQELARRSLFLGCAVDEYKEKLGRGDFVIRNVIAADQDTGALAIGDYVQVGQTVQFHVRDAKSAHEDLKNLCGQIKEGRENRIPQAALLFSCNGRGQNMFETKDHDVSTLRDELGTFPTAGFFCAGELGPIGSRNFLHGFTSSIALFYQKA